MTDYYDRIKSAVENGELHICSQQEAQRIGVFPNRTAWADILPDIGVIVSYKSDPDFALGKAALNYLQRAVAEGRVQQGFILRLERDGQFFDTLTLDETDRVVMTLRCLDGKWGAFWWLPACIVSDKTPF